MWRKSTPNPLEAGWSAEEREALDKGAAYEALRGSAGWKHLEAALLVIPNSSLDKLARSTTTDPHEAMMLLAEYRAAQHAINEVFLELEQWIAYRRELLASQREAS